MARPYWQHDNSLAASRDPGIRKAINEGRSRSFNPNDAGWGKRNLSHKEAASLGFDVDWEGIPPDGYGFFADSNEEFKAQVLLSMFVASGERPLLSDRETEAVAFYLWGDRLPVVRVLYERGDWDGMLWELLAEHPPWPTIGGLMRPTRAGQAPGKGNVQQYVRRAAQKVGTTAAGLRRFAIRGIVRSRNRSGEDQAIREAQSIAAYLSGKTLDRPPRGPRKERKPRSEGVHKPGVDYAVGSSSGAVAS